MKQQIRKRTLSLLLCSLFAISAMANGTIPFKIQGVQEGDKAVVTVSSEAYLTTMTITADGDYSFQNVPTGTHYVKAEAAGYNVQNAQKVIGDCFLSQGFLNFPVGCFSCAHSRL